MEAARIIHTLDLAGVAVFAVSGALAAGRKRMDVFGVLVLAVVTALGGGTLRDVMLGAGPVFWIADRGYLVVAMLAAFVTFAAMRVLVVRPRALLVSDAGGLAVFTAIGTAKALSVTGSVGVSVVMGVMTGVAGGMLRDVLSAEVPLVLRREIYATAALCGSLVYVAASLVSVPAPGPFVASVVVTLAIRLAAIRWGLSLPVFAIEDKTHE